MVTVLAAIWAFISSHALLCGWVAAIMVDQMPAPENKYNFYAWFFGVAQVLAANLNRAKLGTQGRLNGANTQQKN